MIDPIQQLIGQLSKLPGVGERTAMRLVMFLLTDRKDLMHTLSHALVDVANRVQECTQCCGLSADSPICRICQSTQRDRHVICIVSTIQDQMALESTGEYRGYYHILHGTLSPMDGIGPKELRIDALLLRLTDSQQTVGEVIIATPPSVEGEATALYLTQCLASFPVRITRIACGVPVGGDLQFADRLTLSRSLSQRRGVHDVGSEQV